MSVKSEAARPGTTFYAPGVRLTRLASQLRLGAEPGMPMPEVDPDVLRVEVTRVNTGAAQYSITLNNWHDTLPGDRAKGFGADESLRDGTPLWPRYKYNDFDLLRFGDRLRVDLRYFPDPPLGLDAAVASAQNWVPMVCGPVTDMKFSFAAGSGAQVTVSGEDDLSLLQDKSETRKEFSKLCERDIVTGVLNAADFPIKTLASALIAWPPFALDNARGISETLQDGQSYLDAIQKLADRLDFEVFLEFADLTNPASGLEFHFEPARSRLPPDGTLRDVFVLARGRNLLDFTPTLKVADQYSGVVVKGRHRDPQRAEQVRGSAAASVVYDELHYDPGQGDAPLVSGPEMRAFFFPGRQANDYSQTNTNLDEERAAWQAQAALRKKAREFLTVDGVTLGLPRLRPGHHVEVRGMRPPFDGFYYVTKTVHSFGTDGLRTRFSGRRPGMPEPPYGEK
jgi:hypothetical protein